MKKYKTLFCIILTLALMCGLFGCSDAKADVSEYGSDGSYAAASPKIAGAAYHTAGKPREKLMKLSKTETSVLYFDRDTCSVSIYDSNSRKLWNSLPSSYRGGAPAVLAVEAAAPDGRIYTFNSQDDSVAKGTAKYETGNGFVSVAYSFTKALDGGGKISITVPVSFAVKGGVLTASVDCSKIQQSGAKVKTIRLLEYFGSSFGGKKGESLLVPDGCGAMIDASAANKPIAPAKVPVYGADYAARENASAYSAKAACFGIKSDESAFAAAVESGDAISSVIFERAAKKSGYSRVGMSFDLTKTYFDKENGKLIVSDKSFDGEIRISYRFLSGENAGYVGMAGACREALVRNGVLSFGENSQQSAVPFLLSVVGSADSGEKNGQTVLTRYGEAQEILSVLRGKGVGRISVRYRGLLLDSDPAKPRFDKRLGTKKELSALARYAGAQDVTLFSDASLFTFASGKGTKQAAGIDSAPASASVGYLPGSKPFAVRERGLSPLTAFGKNTDETLSFLREIPFDGACVADAGILFSDFSANGAQRQVCAAEAAKQISAVSSNKTLMADGANIYALKYASAVVNLPDESALGKLAGCEQVPFLQILLHGLCDYAGKPFNLYKNPDDGLLKAAEYGGMPYFELYYSDLSDGKTPDPYHYMNAASDAGLAYERMNEVFSSLCTKTITAHYRVKPNVVCTEYGGGTSVYVNYGKKDATVNGVTVSARDFIRVG